MLYNKEYLFFGGGGYGSIFLVKTKKMQYAPYNLLDTFFRKKVLIENVSCNFLAHSLIYYHCVVGILYVYLCCIHNLYKIFLC